MFMLALSQTLREKIFYIIHSKDIDSWPENACGAFHPVLCMLNVQNTSSALKITRQVRSLFLQYLKIPHLFLRLAVN